MAIEKTYARFLTPVGNSIEGKKYVTEEYTLQYADFDTEVIARIREQMADYEVVFDKDYSYEYEDDDYPTRGYDRKVVDVGELISLSSGMYSTDDARGDVLVIDGRFAGVVVNLEEVGGNGWSNYQRSWYAVLYTDGRISGKNEGHYSFYGESSSKENTYTYTLRLKSKE